MPFTKDSARDNITRELLLGATPAQLAKKYPSKSAYRIYNELLQSGQLHEPGTIIVDEGGNEPNPFIPMTSTTPAYTPPTPPVVVAEGKKDAGAETVELGPKTLPLNAVERIRGILGITLRPKVLSCPMPELLYPSMVIAVTELGFKPMRPDDFIDTVLYQWLEACDYIPYAYMKRSELEGFAKTYGIDIDKYAKEHGLMTADEFAKKYGISLSPEEPPSNDGGGEEEPPMSETDETEEETNEILEDEPKEVVNEVEGEVEIKPHKPTTGERLKSLHIDNLRKNIRKEVEDGSSGCAKPDNSQGNNELRE